MAQLHRTWFVHLQGECFGPLSTDVVVLMIKQKRLEYWDFTWTQGLDAWARVADMMPFSEMLPAYPEIPIPGEVAEGTIPSLSVTKGADQIPMATVPPQSATLAPPAPPVAPEPADKKPVALRGVRRHGRARIVGSAIIDGDQTYPLYDLAEGGIFVIAEPPLPTGVDVKFKLVSDSFAKPMNMTGIVIRLGKTEEGQPGFGIQFTRVNPAYSRIIRDYVSAHQDE